MSNDHWENVYNHPFFGHKLAVPRLAVDPHDGSVRGSGSGTNSGASSRRASPRGTPRASPRNSPRNSPRGTPKGSPKTGRKLYQDTYKPDEYFNNIPLKPARHTERDYFQQRFRYQPSAEELKEMKNSPYTRAFYKYASTCSFQGLPVVLTSRNLKRKLVWLLLFIVATCLAIGHTVIIVRTFTSFETSSSIKVEYKTLNFPSVTICNLNSIQTSKMQFANRQLSNFIRKNTLDTGYAGDDITAPTSNQAVSQSAREPPTGEPPTQEPPTVDTSTRKPHQRQPDYVSPTSSPQYTNGAPAPTTSSTRQNTGRPNRPRPNRQRRQTEDDSAENDTVSIPKDLDRIRTFHRLVGVHDLSVRRKLGQGSKDFVVNCAYNEKSCSHQDFFLTLNKQYGNCFTFNSALKNNVSLQATESGSQSGLEVEIFLDLDEYVFGITDGVGVKVVIHEFGTNPFAYEDGHSVMPGTETSFSIKVEETVQIGPPYEICGDDGSLGNAYKSKYSRKLCQYTCARRLIAEQCKCIVPQDTEYFPIDTRQRLRHCSASETADDCALEILGRCDNGRSDCCGCTDGCKETTYHAITSSLMWPHASHWFHLANKLCKNGGEKCDDIKDSQAGERNKFLQENFLRLKVYFGSLNVQTFQEQLTYSIAEFIADVGGISGLWMGASVLTIFELFDLSAGLLMIFCCPGRRNRSRNQDTGKDIEAAYGNNNRQYNRQYLQPDAHHAPSPAINVLPSSPIRL